MPNQKGKHIESIEKKKYSNSRKYFDVNLHVTKQSLGEFVAVHAIFVDTNELSRTIDCTDSDQVSRMDLFMLVEAVHSSQHCK